MVLRGIGSKATEGRRPVPYVPQVTPNSARRRPLRQTGPLGIEGPVSLANGKLCRGQFPLLTGERSAAWI